MGFLDKLKSKSKEEINITRELRYRKARNAVQNYIERMQSLQQRIFEQGRQAAKMGMTSSCGSAFKNLKNASQSGG